MALADRAFFAARPFRLCAARVLPAFRAGDRPRLCRSPGRRTPTPDICAALELAITVATTLFVVSAMVVALHHLVAPGNDGVVGEAASSFVFYLSSPCGRSASATASSGRNWPGRSSPNASSRASSPDLSGSDRAHQSRRCETSERATGEAAQLAAGAAADRGERRPHLRQSSVIDAGRRPSHAQPLRVRRPRAQSRRRGRARTGSRRSPASASGCSARSMRW